MLENPIRKTTMEEHALAGHARKKENEALKDQLQK